jgi:outer membrane protein OmpA-like peptidoglycan-associated protein
MKTILLATALAAFCVGSFAHAQTKTKYFGEGSIPTPIEVARAMAGSQFTPNLKTRGLAVAASTPSENIAVAAVTVTPSAQPSSSPSPATSSAAVRSPAADAGILAMAIPFSFDSARLAPEAAPMLDSVAEGIKLLGDGNRVVIEGHTDAVGNPTYNARLSKSRAQSVKRYLIAKHGIRANALLTQGKGSREPLSGMKPIANENRRVQFRLG